MSLTLRRNLIYTDPAQQGGQLHQVLDPEERTPSGDAYERIRRSEVGPARWQRGHLISRGGSVEDPVLAPGLGIADQLQLPPGQRVERVHHPEAADSDGRGRS